MKPTAVFSEREQQRLQAAREIAQKAEQRRSALLAKAHRLGVPTHRCLGTEMLRERIADYRARTLPDVRALDYPPMW